MRQVISLFCLVGFYVVAGAGLLGLCVGGGMLLFLLSEVHTLLIVPGGIALGLLVGTGFAALTVLRGKPIEPTGIALYRADAPELWSTLDELADAVGTRVPDQVWLSPLANAAVVEQPRLLGLRPGRRYLLLGFPLLQGLSLAQVRAVLAHEFAHFGHSDGRLTALGHSGHLAVGRMLDRFPRRTLHPLSWLFRGYARLFLLVQRAASRRQELAADQVMARIAGRTAAHGAVRMLAPLGAEWHRYLGTYVEAGFDAGVAPEDVFGGFARLLEARRTWLARPDHVYRAPSRWDTHPPVAERLWALESAPDEGCLPQTQTQAQVQAQMQKQTATPTPTPMPMPTPTPMQEQEQPALRLLLPDPDQFAARLEAACFDLGDPRRRVPWDSYPLEAALARLRQSAPPAHRAIARATGQPQTNLAAVLALCAAEDMNALAKLVAVQGDLAAVVLLAAHEAGSVRHVHTWDEAPDQPAFLRSDGSPLDLEDFLDDLFSGSPEGAERARATLTALGIDPAAPLGGAGQTPADLHVSPRTARIIGAMAHLRLDERVGFLFITDLGLLFTPATGKPTGNGKDALLTLLGEPPAVLAARDGATWLPYEELTRVEKHREIPIRATLTLHGGATYTLHEPYSGYTHGASHQTILRVLAPYA